LSVKHLVFRALGFGALAGVMLLFTPLASAATPKGVTCALLSTSKIAAVLGIPITSSTAYDFVPNQLTCYYATKTNPDAALVIFQTQDGYSDYLTAKSQAKPFIKTVKGIGAGAFYDSSADFTKEPEFNVLYGNICMTVDAFAPLKRVEALAKTLTRSL
jgi:hypothetical protein